MIFHNLVGYDEHFIISAAKKEHGRINVIPTNMEKFLSFSIGRMQFLDSIQFAPESLEKLAKTLSDDDMRLTKEAFPDPEQFQLMRKKGVYPYDLITDLKMITSTEQIDFPKKELFFNKLSDENITDEQWEHGRTVFNKYCPNKTLGEYHDLYLHSDVLLLADFFEKYRKTCHTNYRLEPLHYFSAPGKYIFYCTVHTLFEKTTSLFNKCLSYYSSKVWRGMLL